MEQNLAILLDMDDIGVVVDDSDLGTAVACVEDHADLEGQAVVHMHHLNGGSGQEGTHAGDLLGSNRCDNLQLLGCVAANDAGYGCGGDALHTVGIGHDNALDILDDAAAGFDHHPVGHFTQNLSCFGGTVCQCDRFCTAHSGNKLLFEDVDVCAVFQIILCHDVSSFLTKWLQKRGKPLECTGFCNNPERKIYNMPKKHPPAMGIF